MLQMADTLLVLAINDAGQPRSPTACGGKLGQPRAVDVDPVGFTHKVPNLRSSQTSHGSSRVIHPLPSRDSRHFCYPLQPSEERPEKIKSAR
jgi:hypothetical protein